MDYVAWMGTLLVEGTRGNYGTVKLLLDEAAVPPGRMTLQVSVEIAAGELDAAEFEVQVFSNVNRRAFVKTHEPISESGDAGSSYWLSYAMESRRSSGANLVYECELPIMSCGAYRLTARYRRRGATEWWWHNQFSPGPTAPLQRDCAVVVSPRKAATRRLYEANALTVEATQGGDYQNRSTLDDFLPEADFDAFNPFDLSYVSETLGFNTLWLMPVFAGTKWRWDVEAWRWAANDSPGSPYSARDYWSVNPWLADRVGSARARELFVQVVQHAHAQELDVFVDIAFNHAGRDVVLGKGAVELGLCAAEDAGDAVREVRPGWCTRGSELAPDRVIAHYRERAADEFACALWAPADRLNEHRWDDANVDWFFGDYSALGPKSGMGWDYRGHPVAFSDSRGGAEDERDLYYTDLATDVQVDELWRYHAHIIRYWLRETTGQLAGVRCDFAQGLPNQLWEYMINTARNTRWDFVFLAEVLDPDAVQYRLNRVFDILTTKDHYLYRKSDVTAGELVGSLESEARLLGPSSLVMHNGTSHDEQGNSDRWAMVARYAVAAATQGAPMVFMGQPLGLGRKSEFRASWGEMYSEWTREDAERTPIAEMYRRINLARETTPALTSAGRYFLSLVSGEQHPHIFAAARFVDASPSELVLVFVNLNTSGTEEGTFAVPRSLELRGAYSAVNLVAEDPRIAIWPEPRAAESLYAEGIDVRLRYPNEVLYLRLAGR
jgi:hypothetical protein